MVEISSGNVLGSSIEASEIVDGAVSYIKLGTNVLKAELLDTLEFAGEATLSATSLTAYNSYLIIYDGVKGSGTINFGLRINDYAGTSCSYRSINTGSISEASAQSMVLLGSIANNVQVYGGMVYLNGTAGTISNYQLQMSGFGGEVGNNGALNVGVVGMTSGEQVVKITALTSSGTLSGGRFRIYGVN